MSGWFKMYRILKIKETRIAAPDGRWVIKTKQTFNALLLLLSGTDFMSIVFLLLLKFHGHRKHFSFIRILWIKMFWAVLGYVWVLRLCWIHKLSINYALKICVALTIPTKNKREKERKKYFAPNITSTGFLLQLNMRHSQ